MICAITLVNDRELSVVPRSYRDPTKELNSNQLASAPFSPKPHIEPASILPIRPIGTKDIKPGEEKKKDPDQDVS